MILINHDVKVGTAAFVHPYGMTAPAPASIVFTVRRRATFAQAHLEQPSIDIAFVIGVLITGTR